MTQRYHSRHPEKAMEDRDETQAVSLAILRVCVAGHVRQPGGESPLYNLVEVKY